MNKEYIKGTKNYYVTTGHSSTSPDSSCYQVVNRKYQVIEVETFLLPQALKWIDDLQAGLDAYEGGE